MAEDLRARILALYDKHLSPDGSRVGYGAMRRDPDFWAYADATAELQRVRGAGACAPAPRGAAAFALRAAGPAARPVMRASRGCKGAAYSTPCRAAPPAPSRPHWHAARTPSHHTHPPPQVDLSPLGCDALSAFAINLYNALVIHALVVHGTERYKTLAGRSQFFTKARARGTPGGLGGLGARWPDGRLLVRGPTQTQTHVTT